MSSANQMTAVLIAAAQAVSKVFVIGSLGWLATVLPRHGPRFLPLVQVPLLARFSFHFLTLPLIYSTTAQSVNMDTIGNYWFLIAGALYVILLSYGTATVLGWILLRKSNNHDRADFVALRIAATFPNIVALPILIFPSLCEFAVVHEGYYYSAIDSTTGSAAEEGSGYLQDRCQVESTTMIFGYFFSWSLAFWTMGYPQLLAAATQKRDKSAAAATRTTTTDESEPETDTRTSTTLAAQVGMAPKENTTRTTTTTTTTDEENHSTGQFFSSASPLSALEKENDTAAPTDAARIVSSSWCQTLYAALYQTFTSPGFLALLAGTVTGLIPSLQKELFEPAGALRFLGDAIETVGQASPSLSTMVVAASLVPWPQAHGEEEGTDRELESDSHFSSDRDVAGQEDDDVVDETSNNSDTPGGLIPIMDRENRIIDNPVMSDPNFGPATAAGAPRRHSNAHARLQRLSRSVRRGSTDMIQSLRVSLSRQQPSTSTGGTALSANRNKTNNHRRGTGRLLLWFVLSRLFVAPALVVGTIVGLDCGGSALLQSVPNLAKLVVIVNSCLPGALIVVVLLKSNPSLSESAAAVAQVYLPSYLLSIVSIAAWTALGLYVTLPDEEGNIFCQQ